MERENEIVIKDETQTENTLSSIVATDELEAFNTLKETDAGKVVRAMQNQRTLELAQKDEKVQSKIEENARNIINDTTETIRNETKAKANKSHFELNKSSCKMYGFDEERPMWQQRLMLVGASFWFVIYYIVATVTVCPLSVFFDVFKNIFKRGWLAMLVAVIVYLIIAVGIPSLAVWLPQLNILN